MKSQLSIMYVVILNQRHITTHKNWFFC